MMTDWLETGAVARQWWREAIAARHGSARAARARLRRAAGPIELLSAAETHQLNDALPEPLHDPARLALLVRVLAHVDEDVRSPLARRFGAPVGDGRALSALRFQRVVRASTPNDLVVPLIRALPVAQRKCNVAGLARDLIGWGDRVRARWCFDYFGAELPEVLSPEVRGTA